MRLQAKFLVLKWEDIENGLDEHEQRVLDDIIHHIHIHREVHGKSENIYVVINQDEPYFPDVVRLIEEASA